MLAWLSLSENTISPFLHRAEITPRLHWYPVLKIRADSFLKILARVFSNSQNSDELPLKSLADADENKDSLLVKNSSIKFV